MWIYILIMTCCGFGFWVGMQILIEEFLQNSEPRVKQYGLIAAFIVGLLIMGSIMWVTKWVAQSDVDTRYNSPPVQQPAHDPFPIHTW